MKNSRNNFLKSGIALFTAVFLTVSAAGCTGNTDENGGKNISDSPYGLTGNIEDGTIFHAWCQSFNTIKESMRDIAYAGFSAIQTSPINECVVGGNGGLQLNGEGKWYYHYQPTDWTIGNYQLGTKEEFTAMCEEAHKYGIKVIVDVVPNHTTPDSDSVGQGLIEAVGGIDKLYHSNGKNEIVNWADRLECTTGQMGGLPDVNTENKAFQDYFIKYLNECIACGADGFRYDTAKHIGLPSDPTDPSSEKNNFWERVTSETDNADSIFNYGEVLQSDGEKIEEYQQAIGGTTASAYGEAVRNAITSRKLNADALTDLQINTDDPTAVTWVESHDNYCNDGTSSSLSDKQVILAWAVIAAREKGTPLFFDRPYGNTSGNMWGTMNHIGAAGNPFYKDDTVVAVNRFRNAMAGEKLVAAKEVEESICRVAQMGRASGMHLVIATQSPRADVITGLMKANIPSRIAFAVASSLESRIILDVTGAEKLVGKGDMLYAPLGQDKLRVQGCFISEEEVANVVDFIKEGASAQYDEQVMHEIEKNAEEKDKAAKGVGGSDPGSGGEDYDELLPAAIDVVLEVGQASVSMLQRRLKLGYGRAARLVDQMEEKGVVGPFEGSKPRQLLITKEQWAEMQYKQNMVPAVPEELPYEGDAVPQEAPFDLGE